MSVEKLQPRLRYIPATVYRMVKELRLRNQPRAGWGCLYYWGRIGIGAQLSASVRLSRLWSKSGAGAALLPSGSSAASSGNAEHTLSWLAADKRT